MPQFKVTIIINGDVDAKSIDDNFSDFLGDLPGDHGSIRIEEVTPGKLMHPSTASLLKFFKWDHLPPHLQEISRPFGELAGQMASDLEGPELTAGIRKLLEAKDCCVRAALP